MRILRNFIFLSLTVKTVVSSSSIVTAKQNDDEGILSGVVTKRILSAFNHFYDTLSEPEPSSDKKKQGSGNRSLKGVDSLSQIRGGRFSPALVKSTLNKAMGSSSSSSMGMVSGGMGSTLTITSSMGGMGSSKSDPIECVVSCLLQCFI
jgi:hypothetical protein